MGGDLEAIEDWINDIWHTYDKDNTGIIDKHQLKKFIDHTFRVANIVYPYNDQDLDQLFDSIDLTENGTITRAEMRFFMVKLSGSTKPEFIKNIYDREIGRRKSVK